MRDARITVGEPLDFHEWYGREDDPVALRWVTDQIAAAIQAMTGQRYVDVYASRVKSGAMTLSEADAFACDRPGLGDARPLAADEIARGGGGSPQENLA
jgi:1-acyl-sn-glycerol-3-phosphate acyltransferase